MTSREPAWVERHDETFNRMHSTDDLVAFSRCYRDDRGVAAWLLPSQMDFVRD